MQVNLGIVWKLLNDLIQFEYFSQQLFILIKNNLSLVNEIMIIGFILIILRYILYVLYEKKCECYFTGCYSKIPHLQKKTK